MNVAYVSILSAEDAASWSGLNLAIAECLRQQGCRLRLIGPLHRPALAFAAKCRSRAYQMRTGRRRLWTRDPWLQRAYAAIAAHRLSTVDCDVIFSPSTEALADLPASEERPLVVWTDAPMAAMAGYYPWYTSLDPKALHAASRQDSRVFARAALSIFSSDWGAQAAIAQHGANPARVAVVPFGSNLGATVHESELATLCSERLWLPWKFLLVGVDWQRKGVNEAIRIVAEVNALGFASELHIVGCHPPAGADPMPEFVRLRGYCHPREAAGRLQLATRYREATFFLLPSRADATPVAYVEAMAHGLPCIGTRTGGIPSVIRDGINGHLCSFTESPASCAARIVASAAPETYRNLSRGAWLDAQTRLNWRTSGAVVRQLLEGVISHAAERRREATPA